MKLRIALAHHNGRSALATVEGGRDGWEIHVADKATPRAACLAAAKELREAAERFEMLANDPEPYFDSVHRRINRVKLPPNVALRGEPLAASPSRKQGSQSRRGEE